MAAVAPADALDLDFVTIDVQDDDEALFRAKDGAATSSASAPWREYEVTIERSEDESLGLDIDKADGKSMLIMHIKPGPVSEFNVKTTADKVRAGDRIMIMNGIEGDVKEMLASLHQCPRVVCKLRRMVEFHIVVDKASKAEKLGIDVDHGSHEYLSVIGIGRLAQGDSIILRSPNLLKAEIPVSPGTAGLIVKVNKDASSRRRDSVDIQFRDVENIKASIPVEWLLKQACSRGPVERYNEKVGPEIDVRVGDHILEVNGVRGAGGKVQEMLKKIAEEEKLLLVVRRSGEEGAGANDLEYLAGLAANAVENDAACEELLPLPTAARKDAISDKQQQDQVPEEAASEKNRLFLEIEAKTSDGACEPMGP